MLIHMNLSHCDSEVNISYSVKSEPTEMHDQDMTKSCTGHETP